MSKRGYQLRLRRLMFISSLIQSYLDNNYANSRMSLRVGFMQTLSCIKHYHSPCFYIRSFWRISTENPNFYKNLENICWVIYIPFFIWYFWKSLISSNIWMPLVLCVIFSVPFLIFYTIMVNYRLFFRKIDCLACKLSSAWCNC